jgi:ribosomal protein S18 acetylase RimI-like enzyme
VTNWNFSGARVARYENDRVARFEIREASREDVNFLREMLYEAATWRTHSPALDPADVLARPDVALYVNDWGREGDTAVVAQDPAGRRLGAAWYRLFESEAVGFGFVAHDVPEVTLAVAPDARGQGIGTALLRALISKAVKDGLKALSLSVEADNPAIRLYERAGFSTVSESQTAVTMLWKAT